MRTEQELRDMLSRVQGVLSDLPVEEISIKTVPVGIAITQAFLWMIGEQISDAQLLACATIGVKTAVKMQKLYSIFGASTNHE